MRRPAIVLVAAAVLLLAGCSVIPTSGTVKPGTTEAPNGTQLVYIPNDPVAGAGQAEIVSGFLTAASGRAPFTVAKKYLTDGFAKQWRPTTRVLVQESLAKLSTDGDEVRAEIPVSASVDANGLYTPESRTVPLSFHLVQQRGQWRIDSAPNGIVLTVPVFQTTYQPRLLQFYDGSWTRLVSDRRWFPVPRTADDPSAGVRPIVNALIGGPEGPLSNGVAANALQGAKLVGISPTTAGVTTVTLTTPGRRADATVTGRMQQQLVQSLGPTAPPIRLVVDDLVIPQAQPLTDQLSTEAYVLIGSRFGSLSPTGAFTEDRTLGARIAAAKPTSITVSLRQRLAAVLNAAGDVAIVTSTGAPRTVDSRSGLLAPTLDQRGWVYSTPPSGDLLAMNGKDTRRLTADFGDATVSAIQASPDGTRLLVLLDTPTGPQAVVAGILRNASGAPTGLTPVGAQNRIELGGASSSINGATWIDDADVAFLASGNDSDQVTTQQLGGIGGTLGQFANVTDIVGTTSTADLRILVQSGAVYFWNGSNWQQQSDPTSEISVLAVQR
ncbi:LpqB family beta-propeller domain-containing protein [Amnibacterium kyonggiense]|uniref:Lipoprotein LpqB-like beta-propeller protein n=1 Tax=Amnibacterium kyonggiense TaxID=595671 RepID=A0A4R7FEG0_9MICO|nr:LpqB family beta-propeller domain-containing protein [Amnibacterium kyonggiense]TDS74816.1 lipoprotein LpqB-like beta-propeller protein [Amnibacterium kyonggiense]